MKKIMMISDFACPFCYLGFSAMKRLNQERDDIEIQFIPFLLNPAEPLEGSDLSKHISEETIEAGYERIEKLAVEYNLTYNNKSRQFNTERLHLASIYAAEQGNKFEFNELGFKYIFEYGKNVGLPEIVDEIAKKVGLNVEEMNEKIDDGSYFGDMDDTEDISEEYNIRSVPTFIVDGIKKSNTLNQYDIMIRDILE